MVGYLLLNGLGTAINAPEAARWLEAAANEGYAAAHDTLGKLYFFGADDVPVDYARAAHWYQEPAESGDAYAQYLLGYCFSNTKDFKAALRWFLLAANQGDVKAQSQLAWMYYEGLGVDKDLIGAYVWSNLAATASTGKERTELDELRAYISSQLSPEDLSFAQKKTRVWRAKP